MKRLARNPEQIETLNFHAAVDTPAASDQRPVSDPARVAQTVAQFEAGLRDSLATPSRMRGWMSDQLFGLIAADLGACHLVKQEDAGVLFYEDEVKLPDWRLTLSSGASLLVEVKSVEDEVPRLARLRLTEVSRLKRYADIDGTPLYVAINWVAMGLWTLVPIEDLRRVGDHHEIDFAAALQRDHMGLLLNDRMLGLVPPLEVRMSMSEDPESAPASPETQAGEDNWKVNVVVTGTRIFAGGQEMLDEQERSLVWFLILNGSWPSEEEVRDLGDGEWEMVVTSTPEEAPTKEQGFAIAGRLSEFYTRLFASSTTSIADNETTQLRVDIEPGTLPKLVPTEMRSERLPLWHFTVQPSERPQPSP